MANFGLLAAEICWRVWGTPANFNGFRVLAALVHGIIVVGISQTAALNRGCHLHLAGRLSRWALAHILVFVRFSFSIPRQEIGLGNVSEMTYLMLSGTYNLNSVNLCVKVCLCVCVCDMISDMHADGI